ncbi:MAG: substrate-binding domain-containing protein [Dysosmobacter welbionis]
MLRHQGFLTIARERGMEVETVFNPGAVSSAPNGYRLARQVFARPFPQTAVFAPSDAMALGVLQAADELGLDIPGRIPCWAMTISNTPPCRKSASALWPSPPGPWQRALCGCCWS